MSGGCVEGAVVEAAGEVLAAGEPRLLHFGVSDEEAWAVGLSCDGKIDVFVEPSRERGEGAELYERLAEGWPRTTCWRRRPCCPERRSGWGC